MTKVIYRKLKNGRSAASRTVGRKRIPATEGRSRTVHTLDANSKTFDEDLRYVFGRSVAKARRENKRLLGSPDIAPTKPPKR